MSSSESQDEFIEIHFAATSGHDFVLRYPRSRPAGAVDAIFRWLLTVPEFGPKELGVFLAAVLHDAVERGAIHESAFSVIERIIYAVPRCGLGYSAQVNMMRAIMHAAIDSPV